MLKMTIFNHHSKRGKTHTGKNHCSCIFAKRSSKKRHSYPQVEWQLACGFFKVPCGPWITCFQKKENVVLPRVGLEITTVVRITFLVQFPPQGTWHWWRLSAAHVCVWIYIYIYIYIDIYIYIYTYTCIYTYKCIYICIYIYIHLCIFNIYIYIHVHTSIYIYICMYIHMYIYIYTYIYSYTPIYIHICICHMYHMCTYLQGARPSSSALSSVLSSGFGSRPSVIWILASHHLPY